MTKDEIIAELRRSAMAWAVFLVAVEIGRTMKEAGK